MSSADMQTLKPLGSRWTFESVHWSCATHRGQVATIVADDSDAWPYVVQFADGVRLNALDRELLPLDPHLEAP